MPTLFLTAIHLRPAVDYDEASGRLAACLPVAEAHGLEPVDYAVARWREGAGEVFGGPTLRHPEFMERTGDPTWGAAFIAIPSPHTDSMMLSMSTPAEPLGGHDDAWHWLTSFATDLHEAIDADFGLANGLVDEDDAYLDEDEERGGTPAGPEVGPAQPPMLLAPWMYFGRRRVEEDGLEEGLRMLGAEGYATPAKTGAWVLQPREDYSGTQPDDLVDAYARAFGVARPLWVGVN